MATTLMAQWQVHPGRLADFIAISTEGKPVWERYGARNQRLVQTLSGPNGNLLTLTYMADLDSPSAFGILLEGFLNDPEGQAWAAKVAAADSPVTHTSITMLNDIPF